MCAAARTSPARCSASTCFTYSRVGAIRAAAALSPGDQGAGSPQPSRAMPQMRRTREKPLECTPLAGRPSSASPGLTVPGSSAAALGRPHGEAGQVVVARGVHAGHLGGLPAHQGAAGQAAAFGDAAHHTGGVGHRQLAGGEIVQEEQRLGALHHQIVHAHRHQVDAHLVVQAALDGHHQLGAHPVRATDQHRIGEAGRPQVEQRPEAAQARPSRRGAGWRRRRA